MYLLQVIRNFNKMEIPDFAIQEIARLISEGSTGGILDSEEHNRIVWELKIEMFES